MFRADTLKLAVRRSPLAENGGARNMAMAGFLDFVNSAEEVLKAFKTYYDTAALSDVTDPNLILDLAPSSMPPATMTLMR